VIVTHAWTTAVPLSALAEEHTVVFYDTRGRGLSTMVDDPELLSMDHEIADLARVQDHFGGTPAVVVGWSLWGGFVQLFAARHPERVRGVIALGPIEPAAEPFEGMPPLKAGPDFAALEAFWASLPDDAAGYERCLGAYEIILASQVADASTDRIPDLTWRTCALRAEWDENVLFTIGPIFASMGAWDWRDELAGLEAPLPIVHGDEDTVIEEAMEANARIVPDARVEVVEQAGHMGFVEHPSRYVAIVEAFVNGLP
jgi:pimeloyl-ACP methyl ester carboxylesterase